MRELAAGSLDVAIDIPQLDKAQLNNQPLLADEYVCVMRRGHEASHGTLDLDTFLALGHITVSGRRRGRGYVDLALARLGHQIEPTLRLQHYQPAFHVVMASDLVLSAPTTLAQRYDVEILPLPIAVPALESLLYWHKGVDHDPANTWFRELIAQVLG